MEDFGALFVQAIAKAWTLGDPKVRSILARATSIHVLGDEVKFEKEAPTRRGTIQWTAGEDLYSAARKTMVVAAKSRKSKAAYFGNANAYLARTFLESVLMGQTEEGSYVITAYIPPEGVFTEKKPKPGDTLPLFGRHTGRDVTRGMVEVLQATREAVDHYSDTGSTHGFLESVQRGVCYEITQAVRDLVRGSDGAEISAEFSEAPDLFGTAVSDPYVVEFTPSDYPVLETAGNFLAATARPQRVTVLGAVTLLDRPLSGRPGVVRLDVLSGTTARKVRVRLKADDYDIAVDAHRDNLALRVTGRQEVEGRFYWLYDPESIELVTIENADRMSRKSTLIQDVLFNDDQEM